VIPQIDFKDIGAPSETFQKELKKRGVAVIRNVVDRAQALEYKRDVQEYIQANPSTKGKNYNPNSVLVY
jgi:hypothetical protein